MSRNYRAFTTPIAVSLFCGAGGLCLGFEQAGFDVPIGIEKDPIHAATHAKNFPMWATLNDPVETVISRDIREHCGDRAIDVLIGGPPCQGFSIQGRRDPNDPRSNLIKEFIRLAAQLKPKYFVLENVKGLTQGSCRDVLEEAIFDLKKLGYQIPDWQILNAKNYSVPQDRERLFLLGSRAGLPQLRYPTPNGTVTVGDALTDIPDCEDDYWYVGEGRVKNFSVVMSRTPYAAEMQGLSKGSWHQGQPREWASELLWNSHRTNHSDETRMRFASTAPGTREGISHFPRLRADGVSPTLRAGTDSQRGRHTAPRPIHYRYARCITVREMARLSGFPDWFRFDDRKWHGARQIGNAVPPPMARAVAGEVMRAIEKAESLEAA